ncbi:MAG: hypothetical protein NT124_04820 [Candidatus Dependentiae bacterium]|nr:hypothetical protein [Candidatus Dependentiae bacterium]
MNKYLLKTSQVILCTLLASTSVSYTNPEEHDHLDSLVENTHQHFRRATKWSHEFLYSNQAYRPLVEQFKNQVDAFDKEVVALLHVRSHTERGELTEKAQKIINALKSMMSDMQRELSSLIGCKSSLTFMSKMRNAQSAMSSKLVNIEKEMERFKQACDKHKAHKLRSSIASLEKTIHEFKKNNDNAASALISRISTFIK